MELSRRGFLAGMIASASAAAIIRTHGILMPIKPSLVPLSASVISDLMLEIDGVRYGVPTDQGGYLFTEMSKALSRANGVPARFLATPEITARLERDAIRSQRFGSTLMTPAIINGRYHLRSFRDTPIDDYLDNQTHGLPGLASPKGLRIAETAPLTHSQRIKGECEKRRIKYEIWLREHEEQEAWYRANPLRPTHGILLDPDLAAPQPGGTIKGTLRWT